MDKIIDTSKSLSSKPDCSVFNMPECPYSESKSVETETIDKEELN